MRNSHNYAVAIRWTGNRGTGTSGYRDYGRDLQVLPAREDSKHLIEASADRTFHGDSDRWNPEELLLAALSQCHLLSFLHVATAAGVVVTAYTDNPIGTLITRDDGSGQFSEATLRPHVTIADPHRLTDLPELHHRAAEKCFIAASLNFPLRYEPSASAAPTTHTVTPHPTLHP